MKDVEFSPQARTDLREIWLHIAIDNVTAADAMIDRITQRAALLGVFPHFGHLREDLASPPLRFLTEGDYHLIYEPSAHPPHLQRPPRHPERSRRGMTPPNSIG